MNGILIFFHCPSNAENVLQFNPREATEHLFQLVVTETGIHFTILLPLEIYRVEYCVSIQFR